MSEVQLWWVIFGIGVIAFALRYVPMLLLERFQLSPWLQQALRYVPAATLAGLVAPALLVPSGTLAFDPLHPRFLAGLVALFLAWRFKHILLTLMGGMVTLWVLQGLGF